MVLEIIHVVILSATLACGLVVAWYAHRIHASSTRGLAFLDARDVDQRRRAAEASKATQAWNKELHNWLRDTRAILGKLYSIAAESSPHERDTHLIPPPPGSVAPPVPPRPSAVILRAEELRPGEPGEISSTASRRSATTVSLTGPATARD